MCLIIYCPKGSDKNKEFLEEAILKAHEFNPDGMGYAVKREDNSIFLNKGFFDVNQFIDHIKGENVLENEELLIHLRIGNEGKVNVEMSHPFLVSNNENEILDFLMGDTDKPVMAHNGTMKKHAVTNSDKSDTFYFTKNVLSIPSIQNFLKEDPVTFDLVMQPHLSISRVCVMFPEDSDTVLLGKWHDLEGYKFSKNYKEEYFPKPKITYNTYDPTYYSEWRKYQNEMRSSNIDIPLSENKLVKIPRLPYQRAFFKDWLNTTHMYYMGMFLPTTDAPLRKYTISVSMTNYRQCIIDPNEDDYELGIYRNGFYKVANVKPNFIEVVDATSGDIILVPKNDFYEIFHVSFTQPVKDDYATLYEMVKNIGITKSMIKKLEKLITQASVKDNKFLTFRDIKWIPLNVAIMFLNFATEEMEFRETPELLLF